MMLLLTTGGCMRRRQFLGVVGGVAAWPPVAQAQQKTRVYRVVALIGGSVANANYADLIEKSFMELGWSLGRDLEIEYRWGAGNTELNKTYAKEITGMKPDAVLAVTNTAMAALHREASSIPTVFVMVSDPVGMHYVDSFALPGGNVTGFTPFEPSLGSKWLSLLKEIAPNVEDIGLIFNPEPGNNSASFAGPIEAVAPSVGVKSIARPVGDSAEIERLILAMSKKPNGGLIFLPDAFTYAHRERIIALIAQYRLPAIYFLRDFCTAGGLISYGIDLGQLTKQAVSYVSRVLRGVKPGDLPVQAPTKFELVINIRTATALGIAFPPAVLARADEVIE